MVVNPPRSGELINFTDITDCMFYVNSLLVDLGFPRTVATSLGSTTSSVFRLDKFSVDYDSKQLSFMEWPNGGISSPTFSPNDYVTLDLNFGTGFKRHFSGRIMQRTPSGKNNNETVAYIAYGTQTLADDVQINAGNNLPNVAFSTGVTFIDTISGQSVWGYPVADAVEDLFDMCAADLAAAGIPSTIGSPGYAAFSNFLHSEVEGKNAGFVSTLKQLVAHEPTRKVYFDDTQNAWTFPSPLATSIETLTVNSVNVPELTFSEDISNRYTALQIYTYVEGSQTFPSKGYAECEPAWEVASEATWSIPDGMAVDANDQFNSNLFKVFRQWKLPAITSEHAPGTPVRLYVQFGFGDNTRYVPVEAHIDFKNKLATTKVPVVWKGNGYHPGHAIGPVKAWVTWWKINTSPSSGWPGIRYPVSGYEGTAYTKYGIEKCKREIVDPRAFSVNNAAAKLALMKDVQISGSISLEGDPIEEFMNLNRRVNVVHATRTTGLEDVAAMVTGYEYAFGARGVSTLRLSNDTSGLVLTF